MPDSKITALTALTAADPAVDMFPVVDVSDTTMAASGTTKRISINNILAASGTATLASATITGDLTVRTDKLAVRNTGVGIGTASPAVDLHIQAAGTASAEVRLASATRSYSVLSSGSGYGSANNLVIYDITGAAERWRLDASGNHTWSNVGGVAGTAMTLNANGLGIGVTPVTGGKLTVAGPIVRNKGNATLTQNVATTVATLPGEGLFIAYAYTNASNPSAFTSYAVILCDSVGSRVIANNGTQISITTSTFALQVTQIFAATLGVSWSFVQIG